MNFQIDIIPIFIGQHMKELMRMKTYINDYVYESTIHVDMVKHMLKQGAIEKVRGCKRNDATGDLEYFDYPEGVDGAGVMFTSKSYQLIDPNVQLKKAS